MKLFIHRKDLRVNDLAGFDYLYELQEPSVHLFIFDPFLLRNGRSEEHSGTHFLHYVSRLCKLYTSYGRTLHLAHGNPAHVVEAWLQTVEIDEIIAHRDVTPYALQRDRTLTSVAEKYGVKFTLLMDHMLVDPYQFNLFSKREQPYRVFSAFYQKWLSYIECQPIRRSHITLRDLCAPLTEPDVPERFKPAPNWDVEHPSTIVGDDDPTSVLVAFVKQGLSLYEQARDQFGMYRASEISHYLCVGALSIRNVYEQTSHVPYAQPWIRQVCFRDFYLYRAICEPSYFTYEHVYNLSALSNRYFEQWCAAETGIPIIDAAMTELNETGCMPNRLRMLTATFLTKHLLCPFTLGETFFRRKLRDYDNVQNRGNWLWCSSLGPNASPYFRIHNPVTQSQKYDLSATYIRRFLPHLRHLDPRNIHQPQPYAIVDLPVARRVALQTYETIVAQRLSV